MTRKGGRMPKGREFFEQLSEQVKQEFLENLNVDETFEEFMECNYVSFWAFFSCAFVWSKTRQGQWYWHELATKKFKDNGQHQRESSDINY